VVSGGTLFVALGATASGVVVSSGGTEVLSGLGSGTTLNLNGTEQVFGTAFGDIVRRGTQAVETGGTAVATTVSSGGHETVSSGGIADATVVSSGGTLGVVGVRPSS
jgi:autotransporter passenger strand-loop-strand repeat protein